MRLRLLFLSSIFSILSYGIFAQGLCNIGGGGFDATPTEGCAPLTVKLTNTVPNPLAIGYQVNYDGRATNPPLQELPTYTYLLPGTFTMLQQVVVPEGRKFECKKITVYETRPVGAQYTSCGGGKVTISLLESVVLRAYDQVDIQWGDGKTDVWQKGSPLTLDHNYDNVSTSPTVIFTGRYTAGKVCDQGKPFSLPISFQQAQLNDIEIKSVEMRSSGTLRVTYQGIAGIPTEIKYGTNNTNFTTAGTRSTGGTQPYDIQSLNANQIYQVKLGSEDLCQGQRDSKTIYSLTLSGKSDEGENVLTWSQYGNPDGFTGYDLLRDGTVIKSFTSISEVTYTDKDVQCGSFSEYQIVAKIGDVNSISAPVGIKTEIAAPKPISEGSVSVLGSHSVLIKANVPGSGGNGTYSMTIERAEAGNPTFRKIITLFNSDEFSDIEVKTDELSYCYRMSYENACGQKVAASQPICTILLKRNLTNLTWTPERPILGEMEGYEVHQEGSSGSNDVFPAQMNTNYTFGLNAQSDLEYNFYVRAVSKDDEFESLSNVINYKRSAGVFVPDAFSPNGDGFNDVLEAKSTQLQSFEMSILNRWGQVVFHSNDIAIGWDGTIDGTNAPVGSYIYKMTFVDDINQTVEKSGTFMLLR